jgi:hypothetical protein
MNFFYLLLLAHVLADFPLQTDAVFRLKQKSMMGVFLHAGIFTAVALIILFPFHAESAVWIAVLALTLLHLAIDRAKVFLSLRKAADNFIYFAVDQVLHFISIWIAGTWLGRAMMASTIPAFPLYANARLVLILIALVLASFAGSLVIFYVEKSLLHRTHPDRHLLFPKQRDRWPGIITRLLGTLGLILGQVYVLLILLVPVTGYLWSSPLSKVPSQRWVEIICNLVICATCAAFVWVLR